MDDLVVSGELCRSDHQIEREIDRSITRSQISEIQITSSENHQISQMIYGTFVTPVRPTPRRSMSLNVATSLSISVPICAEVPLQPLLQQLRDLHVLVGRPEVAARDAVGQVVEPSTAASRRSGRRPARPVIRRSTRFISSVRELVVQLGRGAASARRPACDAHDRLHLRAHVFELVDRVDRGVDAARAARVSTVVCAWMSASVPPECGSLRTVSGWV